MIRVYHAIHPTFGASNPAFPADYELVAEVDARSLDEAFELTNAIDHPWEENFGVRKIAAEGCRSTAVGDVLEWDGEVYRCEGIGWTKL